MVQKKERHYWQFIALLVMVVVLSCVLVGSIIAWLEKDYTRESEGVHLGEVSLSLYANGLEINGTTSEHSDTNGTTWECDNPYLVPVGGKTRTVNLKVRNTGNIDALLRATIRVYMIGTNNKQITFLLGEPQVITSNAVKIAMNTTGWLQNFPENNQVASGYMYFNSLISPYVLNGTTTTANEVSVVSQIVVPDGYENTSIYISLTLDAVAYSGNIYKKISELSPANISSGTAESVSGDTREYLTFTAPSGFNTDIPVKAFPFGQTLPADWTLWQ